MRLFKKSEIVMWVAFFFTMGLLIGFMVGLTMFKPKPTKQWVVEHWPTCTNKEHIQYPESK